jgi:hypothetical protein
MGAEFKVSEALADVLRAQGHVDYPAWGGRCLICLKVWPCRAKRVLDEWDQSRQVESGGHMKLDELLNIDHFLLAKALELAMDTLSSHQPHPNDARLCQVCPGMWPCLEANTLTDIKDLLEQSSK